MKNKILKRALAFCMSAVLCLSPVLPPQAVKAAEDTTETSEPEKVIDQGALWRFYASGEENEWYIQNVKDETFLASDGKVVLTDEAFPVKAEAKDGGTYLLDFRTSTNASVTKRYFAVGSAYNFSLGESHNNKYMQLYEKQQNGTNVSFVKTDSIESGKEYMIAMAQRNDVATAEATTQYALTNIISGSSNDRITPYVLTISDSTTSADGVISASDKVLTKPYVVFQEPVYSKVQPDALVTLCGNSADQVQTSTSWSPEHETVTDHVAYTTTVSVVAQGDLTFADANIPKTAMLSDGTMVRLAEGEASLSEDKKTITLTHTWPEITDIRIMPDYTVPTGLVAEVGQSLADVALPEGFTFDDASQEAWTQAGYYRYTVTYTPEDTDRYFTVPDIRVTVLVIDKLENYTANGIIWRFEKLSDSTWALVNAADGKYCGQDETDSYIAMRDEAEAVTAEPNDDGTYLFTFGQGTNTHLAVGSSNRFSLGGKTYKTQLFVRTREGNQYVYKKTSVMEEGKDYVFAMAHRDDDATTATAQSLYAMTNQIYGTGSGTRLEPYQVIISEDRLAVVPEVIVDNSLAQPEITIPSLEAGKAFPEVSVQISGAAEGAYQANAVWTPQAGTVEYNVPYQVKVTVSAGEGYKFTADSVPTTIRVGENAVSLSEGAAVLKDEKTMEITYTFAPLDKRVTPDYTVPTGLKAKKGALLGTVVLPDGFSFEEDASTVLNTTGNVTFHLTYTPEDTENYFTVTNIPVIIQVKESYTELAEQGVLWRMEKEDGENKWSLFNVSEGKYLGHDTTNTYIALNDEPEAFTATENEDGTWLFEFTGTKSHLSVGSGNKYSMGERSYKTVLFEKQREGDGFVLDKASSIEDGKEYVVAMAYRDNNATTATATLLYALTNQIDENGGDTRILSYAIRVADGKVDVASDGSDTEVFGKPVVTLERPKAGEQPKNAEVQIPYALEGEYQTATAWTPASASFEQGKAYEASVTITAQGRFTFADDSVPTEILLKDGTKMEVTNGTISADRKTITVKAGFAALTGTANVQMPGTIENGSITIADTTVTIGDTVSLHVFPDEGYELEELKVMAGDVEIPCTKVSDSLWAFTMPEENVSIIAKFGKIKYAVEISEMSHGTIPDAAVQAGEGDTVTLKAVPDRGYEVKSFVVKEKASNTELEVTPTEEGYCFTMPAGAVTVKATFRKLSYSVTGEQSANGSLELSQTEAGYKVNIFITVKPDAGYELKTLSVTAGGQPVPVKKMDDEFYLFSMPDQDVTVLGEFEKKTVNQDPNKDKDNPPAVKQLPAPQIIGAASTQKGVSVKWNAVAGASAYEVYRSVDGTKIKVATVMGDSYMDASPKAGKDNSYSVLAVADANGKNSPESEGKTVSIPANVKKLKVKQSGKNLVVTFKKVKGASQYIVYRSTKKASGYRKVKTIKAKGKLAYTDKKVKKGKTYYYKVITKKGKSYSPLTKAVKKKVK